MAGSISLLYFFPDRLTMSKKHHNDLCMGACACVYTAITCSLKWAIMAFHLNLESAKGTSLVRPTCPLISNCPPLHVAALMSKHIHMHVYRHTHRHTPSLRLIWGRWQTVEPRPRRAERSGSPAGTLTFTLKCFNRTKVDKGRQWRSRSYNGLATLQVYCTLPIGQSYFQSHNPSSASGS